MNVQIIIGSTREGRMSDRAANWVAKEAKNLPETTVEVLDLREYELPFFDEAISPQYNPNRQPGPVIQKWLDKVAEADAYVLVTPEYNRSYPAVLKNAIDCLDFQFAKKPVAIVAHGSSGGAQAVAHLRGVLAGAQSFATPNATYFSGRVSKAIDESGELINEKARTSPHESQAGLKRTLEELKWYSDALAVARAAS